MTKRSGTDRMVATLAMHKNPLSSRRLETPCGETILDDWDGPRSLRTYSPDTLTCTLAHAQSRLEHIRKKHIYVPASRLHKVLLLINIKLCRYSSLNGPSTEGSTHDGSPWSTF